MREGRSRYRAWVAPNTRDYDAWHAGYDDPESALSWRLRTVQSYISRALDGRNGPVRIISACAGDGRDLIGVMSCRDDVARVHATLLEVHPVIAERAGFAAAAAGLGGLVQVRTSDAGVSDAYRDLVPADLVLLVGIFGNISDTELHTTINASAQLCAPGATLTWSRGRDPKNGGDRNGGAGLVRRSRVQRDQLRHARLRKPPGAGSGPL